MRLPEAALSFKVDLSAFQLTASVLPFVVYDWPVHAHAVLPPLPVYVRAGSYITQCRLAVLGYDVQIRTLRDYIIVWKDTGLSNFLHGRAELLQLLEHKETSS